MFYFRFNIDRYQSLIQKLKILDTATGTISIKDEKVDSCEIILKFLKKVEADTGVVIFGCGGCLNDLIEVPFDACSVDIESKKLNEVKMVKYILETYSKQPIYQDKSIEDFGIHIEFCKNVPNAEENKIFTNFMEENNLQYITEDLLWKNMTDAKKAKKFNEFLVRINARSKELIIIDPYLFCDDSDMYCDLLVKIFKLSHVKSIIVITDNANHHFLQSSLGKVKTRLAIAPYFESNALLGQYKDEQGNNPIPIDIKYIAKFHDRFWIADRKKGICCGTSFNGVGKKISSINQLPDDDVKDILQELANSRLI